MKASTILMACIFSNISIIDEGVYVNASGGQVKDSRLQWAEVPSSIGKNIQIVLTIREVFCQGLN